MKMRRESGQVELEVRDDDVLGDTITCLRYEPLSFSFSFSSNGKCTATDINLAQSALYTTDYSSHTISKHRIVHSPHPLHHAR